MKVLLVLVLSYWRMGCMGCDHEQAKLVQTPEAAAVLLWEHQQGGTVWDRWSGRLYRIDLDQRRVIEVPLPSLEFKRP